MGLFKGRGNKRGYKEIYQMTESTKCNVKICNKKPLDDYFGLCQEHYEELLPWNGVWLNEVW